MKNVMIAALLMCSASAVMAQDVVKQITKSKSYDEASSLLKQNVGSLSAEQKAKCYNALVSLAMNKVGKEQGTEQANALSIQLKQDKVTPLDSVGLYDAVYNAISNGASCYEFDQQPNDKGKVKPKYDGNIEKLYKVRPYLINGGIYYQAKGNDALAYKNLGYYVESAFLPMFKNFDKAKDANLTNIAYFAALYAYQAKDWANAEKFADVAVKDSARGKDAMTIKLEVMRSQLKNHADSLAYLDKMKEMYAKDPKNDNIFGTLLSFYSSMNDSTAVDKLVSDKLATDPNNFTAWAIKGQNLMRAQKLEDAIEAFKKALAVEPDHVQINAYMGACLFDRANRAEDRAGGKTGRVPASAMAQIKPLYEEAAKYLEKAKSLDPNHEKANWPYALYSCYYKLYGANDARTIAAKEEAGVK